VADPGFSETGGASTRGKANVPGPREVWTMVENSPKGKDRFEKKNAAQGGSGGIAPPSAPPLDRPLFDIKYDAKLIIPVGSLTASRSSEWKIFRC